MMERKLLWQNMKKCGTSLATKHSSSGSEFKIKQNPFTPYDIFCPLDKSCWMLRNIILFHDLAQQAVTQGLIFEQSQEITWNGIGGSK